MATTEIIVELDEEDVMFVLKDTPKLLAYIKENDLFDEVFDETAYSLRDYWDNYCYDACGEAVSEAVYNVLGPKADELAKEDSKED